MVASPFEKNIEDLLKYVLAMGSLLLIASALTPPAQKSVEPPSGCAPDYELYLRTTFLRCYFVIAMVCSYALGTCVKNTVRHAGGLQGLGAKAQRTARYLAVVAALLSSVGVGIAVATYDEFIQATTVVRTCFPGAHASASVAGYLFAGLLCVLFPIMSFGHVALYAA